MKTVIFITTLLFCILISPKGALAIEFTISNPQVDGQNISFEAKITGLDSNSCNEGKCYLQGGIQHKDGGNYFGFTKNNSDSWIGYVSDTNKQFITNNFLYCTITGDSCETNVSMRYNHDDPKYKGAGDYVVRLQRFTGNSDNDAGTVKSPEISLSVATPTPSATPSPSPTASPSPTPTPTKSPSPSPTPTPTKKVSASMGGGTTPTPAPTTKATATPQGTPTEEQIASLGDATSPPKILGTADSEGGGNQSTRPIIALFMIGGGLAFVGIAGVSFLRTRYNQSTQIPS